jgi:hypothetical protein
LVPHHLGAGGIILKRAESFSASPEASRPFATVAAAATEPMSVANDPISLHVGLYNSSRIRLREAGT